MPKMYGALFVNDKDKDDPIVFVPADGSNAQFNKVDELPPDVLKIVSDQGDALDLTPLGVIVDLS